MKRFFLVMTLLMAATVSVGLAGCSFPDEESRERLDVLEGRAYDAEVQTGVVEGRVLELEDHRIEQDELVGELVEEVRAQAHERRDEEQHEDVWESALSAARCYVSSDPSVGRDYPEVAPELLVETVAKEMYGEYRLLLAEGGVETSRILEVLGALQLPCGF